MVTVEREIDSRLQAHQEKVDLFATGCGAYYETAKRWSSEYAIQVVAEERMWGSDEELYALDLEKGAFVANWIRFACDPSGTNRSSEDDKAVFLELVSNPEQQSQGSRALLLMEWSAESALGTKTRR